jgi:hypothetical protein
MRPQTLDTYLETAIGALTGGDWHAEALLVSPFHHVYGAAQRAK